MISLDIGVDPDKVILDLFVIYQAVNRYADYIPTSARAFIPENPKERTLNKFLSSFEYIYDIIRNASEEINREALFFKFWQECRRYLIKCGYSDIDFMDEAKAFYSQSFNRWRKEYKDSPEGLRLMYEYFKATFGIQGNEEFCLIDDGVERTYNWRRMQKCKEDM